MEIALHTDLRTIDIDLVKTIVADCNTILQIEDKLHAAGIKPAKIFKWEHGEKSLNSYWSEKPLTLHNNGVYVFTRQSAFKDASGADIVISFTQFQDFEELTQAATRLAAESTSEDELLQKLLSNFDYFTFCWEDEVDDDAICDLLEGICMFKTGAGNYASISLDRFSTF